MITPEIQASCPAQDIGEPSHEVNPPKTQLVKGLSFKEFTSPFRIKTQHLLTPKPFLQSEIYEKSHINNKALKPKDTLMVPETYLCGIKDLSRSPQSSTQATMRKEEVSINKGSPSRDQSRQAKESLPERKPTKSMTTVMPLNVDPKKLSLPKLAHDNLGAFLRVNTDLRSSQDLRKSTEFKKSPTASFLNAKEEKEISNEKPCSSLKVTSRKDNPGEYFLIK